ncbi:putative ethylene-responsive transcription factor [Sesbania bispinosa]|nr:putative ethylene-responsive transcription factor [Sesbania bispinosa]
MFPWILLLLLGLEIFLTTEKVPPNNRNMQRMHHLSQELAASLAVIAQVAAVLIQAMKSVKTHFLHQTQKLFDDAYRPDLSNFMEKSESGSQSNLSWGSEPVFDGFPFGQVLDIPNPDGLSDMADLELSEFERMKVERQISASLYAINGVQEYMETVQDSNEALWDLPSLSSFFC